MVHKLITGAVMLFWSLMMLLLVKNEFADASKGIYEVPPSHVFQLMYRQGQDSRLGIFKGEERIGNFVLLPDVKTTSPLPVFEFYGGLRLPNEKDRGDRFHWSGHIAMAPDGTMGDFDLKIRLRSPALQFELRGDRATQTVAYSLMDGEVSLLSGSLASDNLSLGQLPWQQFGIAAPAIPRSMESPGSGPRVVARRCRVDIRGERIDAYRIALAQGETQFAEVTVSQIGQVLEATSTFGYALKADDLLFEIPREPKPSKRR